MTEEEQILYDMYVQQLLSGNVAVEDIAKFAKMLIVDRRKNNKDLGKQN